MTRVGIGLLALVLLLGCGNDPTGSDEGGGGGAVGGCVSGPAQGVTVAAPTAPVVVAAHTGQAMNTMDEKGNPLTSSLMPALARSGCGTVGLLYWDEEDQLRFREGLEPGAGDVVDESHAWNGFGIGLVSSEDCLPTILSVANDEGLVEHERSEDGTWSKRTSGDLSDLLGSPPGWLRLERIGNRADQGLYAIASAPAGETMTGLLFTRAASGGSEWSVSSFAVPPDAETADYALGPDGVIHAVFTETLTYPCDPCNMDLYWGALGADGNWSKEVVQVSQWGEPDDRFADQPSLAVRADGTPLVAARYVRRADTGSLQKSELRVYARDEGTWCHATVTAQQDGYGGLDGTLFTGARPQVVLSEKDRPFVLFHDITQWHDGNGANGIVGQPRVAVLGNGEWMVTTLLSQPGQVESPDPLHGFGPSALAVDPDGKRLTVAGVESVWETDSVYNSQDMPITYRAMLLDAAVE